jgi:hypothetical protein
MIRVHGGLLAELVRLKSVPPGCLCEFFFEPTFGFLIALLYLSILLLDPVDRLDQGHVISYELLPIPFEGADLFLQSCHQLARVLMDLLVSLLEDVV